MDAPKRDPWAGEDKLWLVILAVMVVIVARWNPFTWWGW